MSSQSNDSPNPESMIPEELDKEKETILALLEENFRQFKNKKFVPHNTEVYIFPLLKKPCFPGMAAPLLIEPGPYYELLKKIASNKAEDKYIGLILTNHETESMHGITYQDLKKVGVYAKILRISPNEIGGGAQLVLAVERRLTLISEVEQPENSYLRAKVSLHDDVLNINDELKAYSLNLISSIKDLLKLNPLHKEELQLFLGHSDFTEAGKLADFSVSLTSSSRDELQEILEAFDVKQRLELAIVLLKKEIALTHLQSKINKKIESNLNKAQKEFFLKEQLKSIKKELGLEKDDKTSDQEKFEARLKDKNVPTEVMKVIRNELEKLQSLERHSAEYGVTRGYVDWLTLIPWSIQSKDIHNLSYAEEVLEADHYGLEDIKQRILEFISVGKLSGGIKGSIICLVGPPGVGKTSIGKSIAKALGRKFFRFSVGGMRDEAEIKGHRRTYVGAMPGKLIQALKICETMNPVIMLDEVDKMGNNFRGDPASALLEVLDPEQNSAFLDHYLDVPCDLSQVLFIVTANMLDTIPEPLKDRMDILRLSGYIMQEKLEIAKEFLIPKNLQTIGLTKSQISFTEEAIRSIINGYAREAGVRGLENQIKKVMRKVAHCIAKEQEALEISSNNKDTVSKQKIKNKKHSITEKNLSHYLGKPLYTKDCFYKKPPIGVCTGLAWTALGGSTLYIETLKVPSDSISMKLTGQTGHVMKESSEIAWSYLQSSLSKYAPGKPFFEKSQIHIHIPEGATPKDGPSGGITMATALLSLLINRPIVEKLGMTGELTLTGRVLPIGGLKEKLIASRRSGLKTLIFPKDNIRDYEELPDYIKDGITVHFVEHYDEVYHIAFPKTKRRAP